MALAHMAVCTTGFAGIRMGPNTDSPNWLSRDFIRRVGAILPEATVQDQRHELHPRRELNDELHIAAHHRLKRLDKQRLTTLKVNDCRARQARRRALKVQLPALIRSHGFYRPEIVRHVLTYVGFDLPDDY